MAVKAIVSNCYIEAFHLILKLGGCVVFVPTVRDYKWRFKAPHAYWLSADGKWKIEFVPVKDSLGSWPFPLFSGRYKSELIKKATPDRSIS